MTRVGVGSDARIAPYALCNLSLLLFDPHAFIVYNVPHYKSNRPG